MKQQLDCPYCDGVARTHRQYRDIPYRKESFRVVEHYYKCEKCQEEFTTTESDTLTLTQVHNQYRERHAIPFTEEIIAIRENYELSAAKMSEVLGLGANGYSTYEKGEIPSPAIGNLIKTSAKPEIFNDLLQQAKDYFSPAAFRKIGDRIGFLCEKSRKPSVFITQIYQYTIPNNFNGYKTPDPEKTSALITHFLTNCKKDYNDKLKLNKLLFYTDFHHYRTHGNSISGLTYRAIPYGPAPANYDNLFAWLEYEQHIAPNWIRLSNGSAREVFVTGAEFDSSLFAPVELETIQEITQRFQKMSSWDIVDLSHEEKAWLDLKEKRELIGYQEYAFELRQL